jgi:signal transduction histidine kinase
VAEGPLSTVFANLLRNAQAAAAQGAAPRVLVRIAEERDAAGRRVLRLDVGDSAPEGLSLEQIEARESGRGLSLVRDAVRDWQGHLTIRAESPPFHKSVSACFPVPRA